MTTVKNKYKFAKWTALITVVLFFTLIGFPSLIRKHPVTLAESMPLAEKTIYKTIYSTDDSASLIGFELHTCNHLEGRSVVKKCSVIVREMDPEKDNYKTYCKDIAKDLLEMYGKEKLSVNIFDSFEAYTLAIDESRLLTADEQRYVAAHKIATLNYDDEDGSTYLHVHYYPEADDERSSQEVLDDYRSDRIRSL
ncbi:MAG: hypothetical protein IAE95_09040 [Chitinophagaceae bacterium]|nr:hypothetical protein [Chitinophagaceae bacterium]